jgi:pyroglutamyl-peptidase
MRGKLVIFSFEPFDESGENASTLVGDKLAAGVSNATHVVLPNEYGRIESSIRSALGLHAPRVVLGLGQGAGSSIRIERLAVNLDDSQRPDRMGTVAVGKRIVRGGPAAYWARCDVDSMVAAARGRGHMAVGSSVPGGYMCNHAFFLLLHLAAQSRDAAERVAFIHVPRTTKQALSVARLDDNAHHQPLPEIAAAVQCALSELQSATWPWGERST